MMRKALIAILFWLWAAPAFALVCPSVPNIFSNGTVADANQMNANFTALLNCFNTNVANAGSNTNITAILGLSTPLGLTQGGTGSSAGSGNSLTITPTWGGYAATLQTKIGETFDVKLAGAVGNGTALDGAAVQAAFTAAAVAGGTVDVPCGVYKITQNIAFTVPAGKRITVRGDGADCVEMWFSGAYGLTATYGDAYASYGEIGITWTTDQSGGTTANALTNSHTSGGANGLAGANNFYDVNYRGHDAYSGGTPTAYWGNGLSVNNVSNINVFGGECTGPQANPNGICYSSAGTASSQSIVFNFFGTTIYYCNVGFFYGDYVEGVTMHTFNATGCAYGVNTTANNVALVDQLAIVNSQFNATVCGVCINQTMANAVQISNSLFIMPSNATAIKLRGSLNNITGNMITAASTTGTIGIYLPANGTSPAGNTISDNTIVGFGTGVSIPASVSTAAYLRNNTLNTNTTDYAVGSGASVIIFDHAKRNLALILGCTAGLIGSEFLQADGSGGSYDATATSGAADVVPIVCNGSNWKNH